MSNKTAKAKKKGSEGNAGAESDKREQKLQAVLMADSFTSTFRPLSWEIPKVLMPLANVPMLEYTVEFLTQNGVEEILVVCVWHAKLVQKFVDNLVSTKNVAVRCIPMPGCRSAGDALRELDTLGLVRSDPFVLISGDVVANIDLKKAIEFHKSRRKADANAILTLVLKPVNPNARCKPLMEDLIVGIDKHSAQLVLFDDSHRQKEVSIPLQVLEDHPSVVLRTDLMDTHIHICSPELMLQFSDNFDYQDIRRDFISNEVINWELGMHIYGYLLNTPPPGAKAEYAARVQDPRTYHAISRDIVTRWVEPFVPDGQLLSGSFSQLMRGKHSVYGEEGVQLPATARVGNGVVLGAGTVVGKNVVLNRSIIGRGCAIGAGSTITESHLWAGVLVGTDCTIEHAIIAPGVIIKRGAKIGRGCILAANVVVGEDVHLPNYTRLSMDPRAASELASGNNGSDDDDDGWGVAATTSMQTSPSKKAEYDYNTVGTDGRGYVWQPPSRMQDDEDPASEAEEDAVQIDLLRAESMGCSEEECARRQRWRRVPPPIEGGSDDDAQSDEDAEGAELAAFTRMVADMIVTGHKEGHGADNLLVEIKGLKFAQNKTFADCLRGMMPELLAIPVREDPQARPMAVASRLKQLLSVGGWAHLMIKPFTQGADDEVAIIEEVENAAISSAGVAGESPHRRIFRPILQILYDAELVTEDALLQWAAQRQAEVDEEEEEQGKVTSARLQLFQDPTVQEFVAWLEEDESEEDDDEDEEED